MPAPGSEPLDFEEISRCEREPFSPAPIEGTVVGTPAQRYFRQRWEYSRTSRMFLLRCGECDQPLLAEQPYPGGSEAEREMTKHVHERHSQ